LHSKFSANDEIILILNSLQIFRLRSGQVNLFLCDKKERSTQQKGPGISQCRQIQFFFCSAHRTPKIYISRPLGGRGKNEWVYIYGSSCYFTFGVCYFLCAQTQTTMQPIRAFLLQQDKFMLTLYNSFLMMALTSCGSCCAKTTTNTINHQSARAPDITKFRLCVTVINGWASKFYFILALLPSNFMYLPLLASIFEIKAAITFRN